ncbi:MAG: hypothetical protein AAB783_02580 [Patescibacteria group bacterium]
MENITEVPASIMVPVLAPAGKMLSEAWSFYKQHSATLSLIGIVPAILLVPSAFNIGLAGVFIVSILSGVVSVVTQNALVLAVAENGTPIDGVGGVYRRGLSFFIPMVWASFLTGIAILGGVLLLIIPGIIVGLYFSFYRFTVVLEQRRGLNALLASWHLAKGYLGAILWRSFVFGVMIWAALIIVALIGSIVFSKPQKVNSIGGQLIGNILVYGFVMPFGIAYTYVMYRALRQIKGEPIFESEELQSARKKIIGLSIFAVVGGLLLMMLAGAFIVFLFHELIQSGKMLGGSAMGGTEWTNSLAQLSQLYK